MEIMNLILISIYYRVTVGASSLTLMNNDEIRPRKVDQAVLKLAGMMGFQNAIWKQSVNSNLYCNTIIQDVS